MSYPPTPQTCTYDRRPHRAAASRLPNGSRAAKRPKLCSPICAAFLLLVVLPHTTRAADIGQDGGITVSLSFRSSDLPPANLFSEGRYCNVMQRTSDRLWLATEGKHWLRQVRFYVNARGADINWKFLNQGAYSFADFKDRIDFNEIRGDTEIGISWLLAHEMGHFIYGLSDEYLQVDSGLGMCSDFHQDCPNTADFVCDTDDDCSALGGACVVSMEDPISHDLEYGCTGISEGRRCTSDIDCLDIDPGTDPGDTCPIVDKGICVAPGQLGDPGQRRVCVRDAPVVPGESEDSRTCAMSNQFPLTRWCDRSTHLEMRKIDSGGNTTPSGTPFDVFHLNTASSVYNCWDRAAGNQKDLQGHHTPGSYVPDSVLGPPPPTECQWLVEPVDFGDHSIFLLDRSGSMAYTDFTGTPAVESAKDAALLFYNKTPPGNFAGISSYSTDTRSERAFERRTAGVILFDLTGISASGLTDICQAIHESVDVIEASTAPLSTRNIFLFSDGKQTTGCDPFAAARRACDAGILVHTLAYGDADSAALQQIAKEGCNGFARVTGVAGPMTAEPDPHELKTALAMARYDLLGEDNLLEKRGFLSGAEEESVSFLVPPDSKVLHFAWLGNQAESFVPQGFNKVRSFDQLAFSLRPPDNTVYATDPDDALVNGRYATVRVDDPPAGLWTASLDASELSEAERQEVQIGWLAYVDSPLLEGRAWVPDPRLPRDFPVVINAQMTYGAPLTRIAASAVVEHRDDLWNVDLFDDGAHGDGELGDGIYGGIFNDSGDLLETGGYRVKVALAAVPGLSLPVSGDGQLEEEPELPAPPEVVVEAETSFLLSDRYSTDPEGRPSPGQLVVDCGPLRAGQVTTNLSASITGLAVDPSTTRISLGPGIFLGQLQYSCPACGDLSQDPETLIQFDATVAPDATAGERTLYAQVGFEVLQVENACTVHLQDCNGNGVDDVYDTATGASEDINSNSVPDECEIGRAVWHFSGTAQGGMISVTVAGFQATCTVTFQTTPGDSAEIVVANLAAALNSDPCLSSQDITATASRGTLTIKGFLIGPHRVSEEITDPGLEHEIPLVTIPTLSPSGLFWMAFAVFSAGFFLLHRRTGNDRRRTSPQE